MRFHHGIIGSKNKKVITFTLFFLKKKGFLLTVCRPVAVAPLLIETEEERRLFQKGEENYNAKKALRKRSFLEQAPDQEESNMIHSMWTTGQPYKGKLT